LGGEGLPIRRCGRGAILLGRRLRTRGSCGGVYCVGRIRRRRRRRGTILRVLLRRPKAEALVCHSFLPRVERLVPFWLRISCEVLDLFGVYILIRPFLRGLKRQSVGFEGVDGTCDDWGSYCAMSRSNQVSRINLHRCVACTLCIQRQLDRTSLTSAFTCTVLDVNTYCRVGSYSGVD
jgi:hypothetical protein